MTGDIASSTGEFLVAYAQCNAPSQLLHGRAVCNAFLTHVFHRNRASKSPETAHVFVTIVVSVSLRVLEQLVHASSTPDPAASNIAAACRPARNSVVGASRYLTVSATRPAIGCEALLHEEVVFWTATETPASQANFGSGSTFHRVPQLCSSQPALTCDRPARAHRGRT